MAALIEIQIVSGKSLSGSIVACRSLLFENIKHGSKEFTNKSFENFLNALFLRRNDF